MIIWIIGEGLKIMKDERAPIRGLFFALRILVGQCFVGERPAVRAKCGVLRCAQNDSLYFVLSIGENLVCGLGAETRAVDGCSTAIAEDGGWVDGVAAGVALRCGG